MRNELEILRSIYFDEEDYQKIKNFELNFGENLKELMFEFKKIYELGLDQLFKFIKLLNEYGPSMKPWEIDYFKYQLLNGPFKDEVEGMVKLLEEDNKYLESNPDVLGVWGDYEKTYGNTAVITSTPIQKGVKDSMYRFFPNFIKNSVDDITNLTEEMFRGNVKSSTIHDNTLPFWDKEPSKRVDLEPIGSWTMDGDGRGNYFIKNTSWRILMDGVKSDIQPEIEKYYGDAYKLLKDKREYNPFDSNMNDSETKIYKMVKEVDSEIKNIEDTTDIKNFEMELDIFGDQFEGEQRRKFEKNLSDNEKREIFLEDPIIPIDTSFHKLHTTQGQTESS